MSDATTTKPPPSTFVSPHPRLEILFSAARYVVVAGVLTLLGAIVARPWRSLEVAEGTFSVLVWVYALLLCIWLISLSASPPYLLQCTDGVLLVRIRLLAKALPSHVVRRRTFSELRFCVVPHWSRGGYQVVRIIDPGQPESPISILVDAHTLPECLSFLESSGAQRLKSSDDRSSGMTSDSSASNFVSAHPGLEVLFFAARYFAIATVLNLLAALRSAPWRSVDAASATLSLAAWVYGGFVCIWLALLTTSPPYDLQPRDGLLLVRTRLLARILPRYVVRRLNLAELRFQVIPHWGGRKYRSVRLIDPGQPRTPISILVDDQSMPACIQFLESHGARPLASNESRSGGP